MITERVTTLLVKTMSKGRLLRTALTDQVR